MLVVPLGLDFEYLLSRISCDEVLSDHFLAPETTCDDFQNACSALLESKRYGTLSFTAILDMSKAFVEAYGPPLDLRRITSTIIDNYQDHYMNAMAVDAPVHEIQQEIQNIVPGGWGTAWDTKYEDRALENFKAYLDSLWLERRTNWRRGKPTTHSFCATIVQSSCAGKSRLVYS